MASIAQFTTGDASVESLSQIRSLFFAAFDETFTETDWEHVLGGRHVVVEDGGGIAAHAAVVPRVLEVAGHPFQTGYVEGVTTDPARRRQGLGSQIMREVAQLLRSEHEMGALSTSVHSFYERLGWRRWNGPTYVRYGPDRVRTREEDDGVMVMTFGPSLHIDLTASISCLSRSGDDW
jgi:aminoglycoside 2'-N-acetyltransferase I